MKVRRLKNKTKIIQIVLFILHASSITITALEPKRELAGLLKRQQIAQEVFKSLRQSHEPPSARINSSFLDFRLIIINSIRACGRELYRSYIFAAALTRTCAKKTHSALIGTTFILRPSGVLLQTGGVHPLLGSVITAQLHLNFMPAAFVNSRGGSNGGQLCLYIHSHSIFRYIIGSRQVMIKSAWPQ